MNIGILYRDIRTMLESMEKRWNMEWKLGLFLEIFGIVLNNYMYCLGFDFKFPIPYLHKESRATSLPIIEHLQVCTTRVYMSYGRCVV